MLNLTINSILSQISWLHTILLLGIHFVSIYTILYVPLFFNTFLFSIFYYFITGFGITAGYHRLWSHKAYEASTTLRLFLALAGSGAGQGSILWWCRDHRIHHRFTDDLEKDPYSAPRGFFWSHIGWILIKKDKSKIGKTELDDLLSSKLVMWQNRNYPWVAAFMCFLFPGLVAHLLWNDAKGGYLYAGFVRLLFVQHSTFCVNSLAHWLGNTSFDDKHSPRDNIITSLITLGEGYHNFHHQFPSDYRNAIKYYQYDPTKWLIYSWYVFGMAKNLKTFPTNEIKKGQINMKQKKLNKEKKEIDWGVDPEKLPIITLEKFKQLTQNNNNNNNKDHLIIIEGIVHNVGEFIDKHPGGKKYILSGIGRDASDMFNGGIYDHSNAARNLLHSMRVAKISESINK